MLFRLINVEVVLYLQWIILQSLHQHPDYMDLCDSVSWKFPEVFQRTSKLERRTVS